MIFKINELIAHDKQEKKIAKAANKGLEFKIATDEDKKIYDTNTTVYRLEFPHQSFDEAEKTYNRCYMFGYRHITTDDTFMMLGLSNHKKWTPYAEVSGSKGGSPAKVFNEMPCYKREAHVHVIVLGNRSRSLSEKMYKNESRHMHLKPYKDVCRSEHSLCPGYIQWQSHRYTEFGGKLEDFIELSGPLDFDS